MSSTPTIDLINEHRSIRHYQPDPLPRQVIEQLVVAGQRASTSSNLQTYSVVAVTEAETRQRLVHLCGDQAFIVQAPVFLAWCVDLSRLERVSEMRGFIQVTKYVENFLIGVIDAALAMQNAALAAESLGLGICYVGGIRNNSHQVIKLLGLPKLVFPISGMTVGYPVSAPDTKPRLPLTAVLYWERYDRSNEDRDLLFYDKQMAESGIYDGRQVPVPGNPTTVEAYGWLEHSARRASQALRADLRTVLAEQGFDLE